MSTEKTSQKKIDSRVTIGELKETLKNIPDSYNNKLVMVAREHKYGGWYYPEIIDLGSEDGRSKELLLVI